MLEFTENPKTEEFSEKLILARARARGRACIIKFEKYELSGFTGKKIIKFGLKLAILEKIEICKFKFF